MAERRKGDGEAFSFIGGLIVGFIVSAPVAAWLSPRAGGETRRTIVQQGVIIRRRVGDTLRRPVELAQEQLEQLKRESVEAALGEGKTIAAQTQAALKDQSFRAKGGA
jgi:gas vesicle protein